MSISTFTFPSIYNFPPFFTPQPHPPTREKQIQAWLDLIRDFCSFHRIFTLNASTYFQLDLFHNKSISRSLSRDFFHLLLTQGVKKGYMQWVTKEKVSVWILWRSFEEWGRLIHKWTREHGFTNTVVTGYEIRCGELVSNQEFYRMEESAFLKVIQVMEKSGQVAMVNISSVVDELGFKIIG